MVDQTRQDELRRAIELLFFGYRAFTDRPDRILEGRGLGRVHHRILYFVGRNRQVSVKGLLEILAVSKQALSAPLRRLQALNLVAVMADAGDRRIKRLILTDEGRRLEAELTGAQMRHLLAAFDTADPADEAAWMRVMETLASIEPAAKTARRA
jgi:DNA-binding MarR family transcriptional regulator